MLWCSGALSPFTTGHFLEETRELNVMTQSVNGFLSEFLRSQ